MGALPQQAALPRTGTLPQTDAHLQPGALLNQANDVAFGILDESRTSLMMTLRFMDAALWRMPFSARMLGRTVGTDGRALHADPVRIIKRYQTAPAEVVRDHLHAVLHCIFRHPFDSKHSDSAAWNTACDVAVEAIAMELVSLRFPSSLDKERTRALAKLKERCPQLTAQKIYRAITAPEDESPLSAAFALNLQQLFARDDHSLWPHREEQQVIHAKVGGKVDLLKDEGSGKVEGANEDIDENEEDNPQQGINMEGAPAPSTGGSTAEGDVKNGDRLTGLPEESDLTSQFASMEGVRNESFEGLTWKDISKQIEADLEGFPGKIGVNPDTFLATLAIANRKTYDYKDFLRRFSSMSEEMKTSTEEFDYVYYTYGLKLYGNMPLIEPLEYQESDRVRDFVIAVDTSGSCAGALVKRFVEKTYDLLKSSEGFGRKLNVHIVQCDCDVRKDTKITSLSDLENGWNHFDVRGFGGTDFRPVFKYVNDMVERREFTNLKGLIYFTDGYGTYPTTPPAYETVFAFTNDSGRERKVPPWAMKVILDEDEIYEL